MVFLPLLALALVLATIYFIILKIAGEQSKTYKQALAIGLFGGFMILWIEGGVGINGPSHVVTEWIEISVFSIGVIGALLGWFKPMGMSWALLATAIAQLVGIGVAIFYSLHLLEGSSVQEIFLLNGFFATIFFGSAFLFRKASKIEDHSGDLNLA